MGVARESRRQEDFTGDADDIHVRKIILEIIEDVLDSFGDHVHPHSITCAAVKPHEKIFSCYCTLDTL